MEVGPLPRRHQLLSGHQAVKTEVDAVPRNSNAALPPFSRARRQAARAKTFQTAGDHAAWLDESEGAARVDPTRYRLGCRRGTGRGPRGPRAWIDVEPSDRPYRASFRPWFCGPRDDRGNWVRGDPHRSPLADPPANPSRPRRGSPFDPVSPVPYSRGGRQTEPSG